MRLLYQLAIIVVGTLFVSALLTPVVFSLLLSAWPQMPWPFSRVFHRVAMLALLGFIVVYRSTFSLEQVFRMMRQERWSVAVKRVCIGMVITFSTSICLLPYMVDGQALQWNSRGVDEMVYRIAKVIPAGLIISVLEESFFRVILFLSLVKVLGVYGSAVVSSVLYGIAHFISPAKDLEYTSFSLTIGFEYLLEVLKRLSLPGVFEAGFGLFLVGLTLCFAIWKIKSLWLCIGLHAGWVVAVKLAGYFTLKTPTFEYAAGAGRRYFLVSQPEAWVSVLLVAVVIGLYAILISRRSEA